MSPKTIKKSLVYGLALLSVAALFFYTVNRFSSVSGKSQGDILAQAFGASGAEFTEWQMVAWSKLNQKVNDSAALVQKGKTLTDKLGMSQSGERLTEENDFKNYLILGTIGVVQVEILMQTLPEATYLVVTLTGDNGEGELSANQKRLEEAFAGESQTVSMNTLITGTIDGALSNKEAEKLLNQVFASVDAKIMEKTKDETYYSYTGYQPNLPQKVLSGARDVNLQVAISFDEEKKQTLFYLGSPLLFGQY